MHLHDVIRLWRQELVSEDPQVAISEELAAATGTLLEAMPRDILPGGLRRDERSTLQVRLLPAAHRPERPADNDSLDSLEQHLGFELPRSIELL
ncbi:MAG: hypothetical protein VX498_03160, partial [Myxococcota bacterium]|nr:hypothetical protein [Myxococcota bacterium]